MGARRRQLRLEAVGNPHHVQDARQFVRRDLYRPFEAAKCHGVGAQMDQSRSGSGVEAGRGDAVDRPPSRLAAEGGCQESVQRKPRREQMQRMRGAYLCCGQ